MVDVKIDDGTKEGVVIESIEKGKNKYELEVKVQDGKSEKFMWPSAKVTFCGNFLPAREC